MYKPFYKINNNFSRVAMYLLGEIKDYTGSVESTTVLLNLDRLTRDNMEIIRINSNKPQAELYEEEVSEMVNHKQIKSSTAVKKETGVIMIYYKINDIIELMTEMTLLAQNMLNVEEE